jgi:hypothetical protein
MEGANLEPEQFPPKEAPVAETALQKAAEGKPLSEKAAKTALGEAIDKMSSMKKKVGEAKETMDVAGRVVLNSAINASTLFGSSFASGALGEKWMKPGNVVDIRPLLAGGAGVFSLYSLVTGGNYGDVSMSIANGVGGSWLAEVAQGAGKASAEMWAKKAAETTAAKEGDTRVNEAGKTEVYKSGVWTLAGAIGTRDIRLTPEGRRRGLPARRIRAAEYEED